MGKVSLKRVLLLIIITSLLTSCTSLNLNDEITSETVTTVEETTITTLGISENEDLVEFNEYTSKKNKDNTYNLTITQDGMENCYYVISLMYDDKVLEFVEGDGYIKSSYGKFAGEVDQDITTTEPQEDNDEETEEEKTEEVTTMSADEIQSLVGKDGKWTFKCISEGTEYIEIKLINEFGDVRYKSQFTCIVDTHLEPHMYYTSINY